MFRELDSDFDNVISADAINLSGLPYDTIKCLKPIFEELDTIEEGINEIEFIEAATRLYDVSLLLLTSTLF